MLVTEVLQLCRSALISCADMVLAPSVAGLFKWRQFEPEMILLAVGWYLRFSLSYRDVEELLAERGWSQRRIASELGINRETVRRYLRLAKPAISIAGSEVEADRKPGVSIYTFRDERDLLWYSTVFSSADRESAYVIDGLMHNEVVKSDIHSTDTFGFSELVFGVSHLLGFSYAPRFKNLKRQRLYIFKSRRGLDRSAWKIKPSGYIDD